MRLLERDHVRTAFAEYLGAARGGEGRLVLVCGEAGAGKSSVIDQLHHDASDARWALAGCDGLFTPRPLGPLFDIADQLGGDLLAACRRGASRDELFLQLVAQIRESDELTVLVVEDAHWADESTLDLLRFLGRRIRGIPAVLLVTYRDDALASDDTLRVVLGALASERVTRRVSLAPLSLGAVAELAAGSGLAVGELHRLTGGNPFFVTEVIRSGAPGIPASARDAVLSRVARLTAPGRRAVEVAALAGTRVEPALLESAAVAAGDLDELAASGLLVSDAGSLRFRHEIVRLAVEQETPAHRRASIHALLLEGLLASGSEDDARLAFHAEGAGDGVAVLRYASSAGRRDARLYAHREAAAHFAQALRFAADVDPAVAADLNERLAVEASFTDSWELAAVAGTRALALWHEVGDPMREAATLRALADTMFRLCRGAEALSYARAAVAVVEPYPDSAEAARAYALLATTYARLDDAEPAFLWARRAEALAVRLDLPDVLSDALNTEACKAFAQDQPWQELLQRALRTALDGAAHQQAARAYANLVGRLSADRRFDEAEGYVEEGTAFCDEHDIATFGICVRATHGEILLGRGRWDEAADVCRTLLADRPSPFNRLAPQHVLGRILARRDDDDAWRHLDAAVVTADTTEQPVTIAEARIARAEAHWLAGDPDAARRDIDAASGVRDGERWVRGAVLSWQRRLGLPATLATHGLPAPYRRELAGDFAGAAASWDELGCPFEAAQALLDSGTEGALREALRRFEALGAVRAAKLTRREMRRLGLRAIPAGAQPSTRAHPAGLTRREHEILRLICAGHTNAEISDRLVISMRTVDHHVSAVLGKLRVPSRTAAAAEAARLGLLDPAAQPGAPSESREPATRK